MKKIFALIVVLMIAVFLIAAVKPALLTVKNRTDSELSAYLYTVVDGVEIPALYATVPFKSERQYELPPGSYLYEVFGCGQTLTGEITLRGHFTLVVPHCDRLDNALQQRDGAKKALLQE